ncbi:hypothetical protein H2204_009902 [Knufia peltigerae]|uniref:Uncharacterized protein n=1 Tax=Knufia peltigerae TaxID=1002370 RepID=A0AA39CT99_9EURO|nr:hypothetical protein H2204_009902 [Knufia peltigerae]
MAPSTDAGGYSLEPIKALTLLDLGTGRKPEDSSTSITLEANKRTGIWIRGLDTRFRAVWRGGRVVGIGSRDADDPSQHLGQASLSLNLISAALLNRPDLSQILRTSSSTVSPPLGHSISPTIYIVAPHTAQTIPLLHGNLARMLSDSATAMELLKGVQLLQYFDFAGLVEAVGEVSEAMYGKIQSSKKPAPNATQEAASTQTHDIVLLQGLSPTVTATYRRSGLVHANALLAALMRSIVQLSRPAVNALVLVDVPIGFDGPGSLNANLDLTHKSSHGVVLGSAFCGPTGENLSLVCGHETLSRTLESGFDCIVIVHDGFGRVKQRSRHSKQSQCIIETVKDRVGDTTGLWAIWSTDGLE